MLPKVISQRTLVSAMCALRGHGTAAHELEEPPDLGELLYENDFPDWFVTHSRSQYSFDWLQILPAVRNTQFLFPHTYYGGPGTNITGKPCLGKDEAAATGKWLLQRLAALASTGRTPNSESGQFVPYHGSEFPDGCPRRGIPNGTDRGFFVQS